MEPKSFREKYGPVALVTGASSGIGRAFAHELAARKIDLILVARREALLRELQNELQAKYGISVRYLMLDLTEPDASELLTAQLGDWGVEIGLLVNNAGYGSHGEFDHLLMERELAMVDLACRVQVALAYSLISPMKERQHGGIIFVSSVLSQFPTPYMATYAAGKTFEFSFATSLYGELRPHGIDVLALLPGTTDTDFFRSGRIEREYHLFKASPRRVARTALKALGKKPYVVDGFVNRMFISFMRMLPVRWASRLVGRAMRPKKN